MAYLNEVSPTSDEGKLLTRILDRKESSIARFGGQNDFFRDLNRNYFSLPPPRVASRNDVPNDQMNDDEPNIVVPIFFTILEQMLPVWMFGMFGNSPTGVTVLGRTEEDHANAENIQLQLEYDFQMGQVFKRSVPIGKQCFKYGTGIFQVGYRYDAFDRKEVWTRTLSAGLQENGKIIEKKVKEDRTKKIVRFDGPWLEPVSVTNAFPDPLYAEVEEMRYFLKRRYTDMKRLKWEDEMHYRLTAERKYKNLENIPIMSRRSVEELLHGNGPEEVVAEALGWSSRRVRNYNQYVLGRGKNAEVENQIIEVTEYWSIDEEAGEDKFAEVANGSTIISDGPIPWEDKLLPFGAVRCFPIENEFWGYGLFHPILRSGEGVTGWRNMMMENAAYNSLRTWGTSEEMSLPKKAKYFRPGDVTQIPFDANGKPLVVDLFAPHTLPAEAFNYEDRMISDIQRAVGSSAMIEPTADTATEANYQRQGVVMKDRLIGALTEVDYLTKVAQFFISRRQQFYDEEMSVRTLGPKKTTFKKLSAQDIAGQFDYIATGSQMYPAKNVSRQQLIEALGLTGTNPALAGITDYYEFFMEILKNFEGIRSPERLLNKPTEKVFSPEIENPALLAGIEIGVDPGEMHEKHIESHNQAKMLAIQSGKADSVAAIEAHIAKHMRFLEMVAQTPPAQEMPGPLAAPPGPGTFPNMDNVAPSEGSLEAGAGGIAGGAA